MEACFACRRRLPIAIGDSAVRGIDRVDPEFRLSDTEAPAKAAYDLG
jgi:hypothetical protein